MVVTGFWNPVFCPADGDVVGAWLVVSLAPVRLLRWVCHCCVYCVAADVVVGCLIADARYPLLDVCT